MCGRGGHGDIKLGRLEEEVSKGLLLALLRMKKEELNVLVAILDPHPVEQDACFKGSEVFCHCPRSAKGRNLPSISSTPKELDFAFVHSSTASMPLKAVCTILIPALNAFVPI